jgi:hypothetical protein
MKLCLTAIALFFFTLVMTVPSNADCDGGTGTCGGSCKSTERACYHKDGSATTCVDDSGCPH